MLTGLRRQPEQMCSERRPRWLVGEFGDDLVGSAVEHLNDLVSDELLRRHMKAVGVTPDGVTQPGCRVAEFSQHVVAEAGLLSRVRIWCRSRSACAARRSRVE